MVHAKCHTERRHYSSGLCGPCYRKDWYSKHPGALKRHHRVTYLHRKENGKVDEYHYKKYYGISKQKYVLMFAEQSGRCAICMGEPTATKRLAVDHCHKTGRVRGLLCHPCNLMVGLYERKPDISEHLETYLEPKISA